MRARPTLVRKHPDASVRRGAKPLKTAHLAGTCAQHCARYHDKIRPRLTDREASIPTIHFDRICRVAFAMSLCL